MHRWNFRIEEPQAEALQIGGNIESLWNACASLAAAAQVLPKPSEQMTVQPMEYAVWMTMMKIRLPAS